MKISEKQIIIDSRNDILDVVILAQSCMINSVNTEYFDKFEEIAQMLKSVNEQLQKLCPKS